MGYFDQQAAQNSLTASPNVTPPTNTNAMASMGDISFAPSSDVIGANGEGNLMSGYNDQMSTGGYWDPSTGGSSSFDWGGLKSGLDIFGSVAKGAGSIYGIYQGIQQQKLAKEQYNFMKNLAIRNYQNQAMAYNDKAAMYRAGQKMGGFSARARNIKENIS